MTDPSTPIEHLLAEGLRFARMTNEELVRECLRTPAADYVLVNEMMTRLHPGWEDESDAPRCQSFGGVE